MTSAPLLGEGTVVGGRFRIERMLARGGQGVVYEARHVTIGARRYAIKQVHAPLSRVQDEAALLATLDHPGIVRVTDYFEEPGGACIVMDLIEGRTLREPPSASIAHIVGWLLQICDVLEYLHAHDPPVLMRDLKPSNVMLDGAGRIRLVDFGIAQSGDGAGDGAGTQGYAPLEQIVGQAETRSDIYALGATAYWLLTHRAPPNPLLIVTGDATLQAPREINGGVPPALSDLVMSMLALRKHERPSNVAVIRAALSTLEVSTVSIPPVALEPPSEREGEETDVGGPSAVLALPPALTPFFGREAELAALEEAVAEHRLVTLTGMGGTGKTRLAMEWQSRAATRYADGVRVVPLESDADMLPRLALALGFATNARRPLEADIHRFLAHREMVLVLDGVEREMTAPILALLAAAPRVRVLCVGRRRLHVQGERIVEVGGLSVPPKGAGLAEAARASAVALFCQRASLVSRFRLDDATLPDVIGICASLSGHPLSIEIAASRATMMTVGEIRAKLADRFRILVSDSPQVPERQRTLRGIIEWSCRLLAPAERDLLSRLTIFRDGFWLESVDEVLGDASQLILALRDLSLVACGTLDTRTRYWLPESIHQFAAEGAPAAAVAPLHARHFCARLEAWAAEIRGPGERAMALEIFPDLENVQAAFEWSEGADPALGARLGTAAARMFRHYGLCAHAHGVVLRALDCARRADDRALGAFACMELASVRENLGALDDALDALGIVERAEEPALRARALNLKGIVLQQQDRLDAARECYQQALALRMRIGDRRGAAVSQHNLAWLAQQQGQMAEAERAYREVEWLRLDIGDERGLAETLNNLGEVLKAAARPQEAEASFRNSIRCSERLGHRLGVALARHNLGELYLQQRRAVDAERELSAALHAFESLGSPYAAETRALLRAVETPHDEREVDACPDLR